MAGKPRFGKRVKPEKTSADEEARLISLAMGQGYSVSRTAVGLGLYRPGETVTAAWAHTRWLDFVRIFGAPASRTGRH